MTDMLIYFGCFSVGAMFGVFVMSLCIIAGRDNDDQI